ncbi:E3 ubiquitin-protein ligase RNFT1-like [Haliotis rubra]|uniref:E3 ubiquitin-protein ligase RNFT1-like n=1 Tax=Haliotis rubra TaxID=36100 RepID=UPI001EE5917E|nr:E3 ubiquitin-protein ligase RNFT1-like [Haliotis rubra]
MTIDSPTGVRIFNGKLQHIENIRRNKTDNQYLHESTMNEDRSRQNPNMDDSRRDSDQNFSLRLGNLQMPLQIQNRLPLGRNMTNMAQGFLPHFQQSSRTTGAPALSASVISEPSAVIDMSSLGTINSQATIHPQQLYGDSHNHGHGHGHGHSHGHGHAHMAPMQDENQNHNIMADNQNPLNELQQNDWRPFLLWFQKCGIFFVLLFMKLMYDHRLGLLVFFALGGTFYYANMKLVQFIHQTAVRESRALWGVFQPLWLISFLTVNIAILYYAFSEQNIWKLLLFKMPNVNEVDIWTLLWIVLLTDYIIKFSTVILKSFIAMVPLQCLPHKRRGKYFMFVEHVSQCYRHLIPIIPWIHFLSDDQQSARWFSILCVIVYGVFKLSILWGLWRELIKAFNRLRVQANFGVKPTPSELKNRGEHCPICQDDYKEPVMLTCKHVFCEDCVSLWFDRERTCPMCRAQITDNPHFQDGSTSFHLQWY